MALFYNGPRPVLKGRNKNNAVHPYNGVGKYSNWDNYNTDNVFDGAPNINYVPGSGRFPHGVKLSKLQLGTDLTVQGPMKNVTVGAAPALTWYRKYSDLFPLQGRDGQSAFHSGYGHLDRVTSYSLWDAWTFHGVNNPPFKTSAMGHAARKPGQNGAANDFGIREPHINKGVTKTPLNNAGSVLPTGYNNLGGKNKINEWRGIAAATALKTS